MKKRKQHTKESQKAYLSIYPSSKSVPPETRSVAATLPGPAIRSALKRVFETPVARLIVHDLETQCMPSFLQCWSPKCLEIRNFEARQLEIAALISSSAHSQQASPTIWQLPKMPLESQRRSSALSKGAHSRRAKRSIRLLLNVARAHANAPAAS